MLLEDLIKKIKDIQKSIQTKGVHKEAGKKSLQGDSTNDHETEYNGLTTDQGNTETKYKR